jgi:geranylgeranyl pyrophosphate synthase
MIHTASLLHDDVLDHAETRRGKTSVNARWDARRSSLAGDYILAVSSRLLAAIRSPDVVQILSQASWIPVVL